MFEVIRDALIWIMSLVLDHRPRGGEAFRLLFLIAFSVFATWLTFYWKDLAYRYSAIRRRVMPEERYAGRYLQAVWRGTEVNYSFVNIFYNWRRHRYEVAGRTYNPGGDEITGFTSQYVLFPADKDADMEFIWRGSTSEGYTLMRLADPDEDYIQGDGHVITFDVQPKVFPIQFKHLHDHHVRQALGVASPSNSSEEPEFVKKFHAMYGERVLAHFNGKPKAERELAAQA
jgi:hypothetical protein